MVQTRGIEPRHQVCRSWTRRGHADTQLSCELGVGAGHEGGHLLMPGLDEFDLLARAVQRAKDAVYAVSGIAENEPDTPLMEPLDEEITDCLCHGRSSRCLRQPAASHVPVG